jgi:hypothetical protein
MDQKQIKSKIAEGYIYTRIILEVVGKPKNYVEETLKDYVKKIKEDKSYILVKESYEKAAKQDELFSAFSEMELLFEDADSILSFCFDFMPSSIEIVEPENITLNNSDFTGFVNDMLTRMHGLNTNVIQLSEANRFFIKNTAVLLRNFVVVLLSSNPMSIKEMTPYLGVKEEDIGKVVNVLVNEGKLKKQGDKYVAVPK